MNVTQNKLKVMCNVGFMVSYYSEPFATSQKVSIEKVVNMQWYLSPG